MKETGSKRTRGYVKIDMAFKRKVVRDYLNGGRSYSQLSKIYGVNRTYVYRWVQKFSSDLALEPTIMPMTEEEQKELEALKAHNALLQQKLEQEQLRNFALETMIDLAKEQLGVDVRKNSGAKQSKQ